MSKPIEDMQQQILYRAAEARLEEELLAGLEGEDIEVTPETWRRLEAEALEHVRSKHSADSARSD